MKIPNKRMLTNEEVSDAQRLASAWEKYGEHHNGATQLWLANVTGLGTQSTISQYLRGIIPLNHKALLAICDAINIDPANISPTLSRTISGIRGRTLSKEEAALSSTGKIQKIPTISAAQACEIPKMTNPYPATAGFSFECVNNEFSPWIFSLEIDDDSMMPEFRIHDRILIDPKLQPNPGDFVVARPGNQNEIIFRKYKHRGKNTAENIIFDLTPLNDDYPTIKSDIENLKIIGVLIEHRKKYRINSKK